MLFLTGAARKSDNFTFPARVSDGRRFDLVATSLSPTSGADTALVHPIAKYRPKHSPKRGADPEHIT
jgi:hypothetical protein